MIQLSRMVPVHLLVHAILRKDCAPIKMNWLTMTLTGREILVTLEVLALGRHLIIQLALLLVRRSFCF